MSKFLNNIFHGIIVSQAWVALCFSLFCLFFQKVNHWDRPELILISFFATLFAYNLAHWQHDREKFRILIMVLSLFITAYQALIYLSIQALIVLAILGLISVLYSVPQKMLNLRHMPGLKIWWIALVWSVTVVLPCLEMKDITVFKILLQSVSAFCFVAAITIPFDIRDLRRDQEKMQTLPQKMGYERSILFATQLLVFSGFLFLTANEFQINRIIVSYILVLLISIWLVRKTSEDQNRWFAAFWIEGLSGLFFVCYLLID